MKSYIVLISIVFFKFGNLSGQKATRFSIGFGSGMLVDMQVDSKNSSPDAWPIQDMATHLDKKYELNNVGYYANIDFMVTRYLNVNGGFNFASLSGSNSSMYYHNNLRQLDLGLTFMTGNYNLGRRKIQFNPLMGMTFTEYESTLYFKQDNSAQNFIHRRPWGAYLGMGVAYRLSPRIDIVLNSSLNMVFDNGMDGWDYSNGTLVSSEYWRNNIGLNLILGKQERHLYRYGLNHLSHDEAIKNAENSKIEIKNDSALAAMVLEMQKLKLVKDANDELLSELQNRIHLMESEKIPIKGGDTIKYSPNEIYKKLIADLLTATLFFERGEAVLDAEDLYELFRWKRKVFDLLNTSNYYIVISANTDASGSNEINLALRNKRAEIVKKWIVENTGITNDRVRIAPISENLKTESNDTFQRICLVEIEFE